MATHGRHSQSQHTRRSRAGHTPASTPAAEKKACSDENREHAPVENRYRVGKRGPGSIRRLLIVSMATWWCFYVDNCVLVEAQSIKCPTDCNCYDDTVNCEGRGLRTLPPLFAPSTQRLTLGNNNIRELRRNVFKQIPNLVTLDLSNNVIVEVPSSSFSDLKKLRRLDLSGNRITGVPRLALARLGNLEYLSLRNNPIAQLLAYDFIEGRRTLRTLDIGELRQLNYVSNQAFSGLQKLEKLRMNGCQLREIPSMRSLVNLQVLDLSSNKVQQVRARSFIGMERLVQLSLAYCDIRTIEEKAFRDLTSLESLSLASNNLTTIYPDLLPNSKRMQFEGNPWLCNCDLLQFARYLEASNVCSGESCGRCRHPIMYRRMPLVNLTRVQNPPCAARIVNSASGASMNVSVGDSVKIPCPTVPSVKRKAKQVQVKWYRPDGSPIRHGRFEVRIKPLGNGSLNFTFVTMKDTGVYRCAVTRNGTDVAETTIFLNVTQSNDVRMFTSVLTTETTVIKSRNQNPPPTFATNTNKWFTYTDRPASYIPSRTRTTTTRTTTTSAETKSIVPVFKQPVITNPQDTADQVMETTKIIVGCFVGITLLAAALLIIFYKLRQRSYNQRRGSRQHKSDDLDQSIPRDTRIDAGLLGRNAHNRLETLLENSTLNANNTFSPSANTTPARTPCTDSSVPMSWKPSTSYAAKPVFAPISENAVQVLPPPPEELKFQTTRNNRPRAPPADNFGAQTLPGRGSGASPVPRQLLSNIASSCQQVAMQRRSYVEQRPGNGNHSNNQQGAALGRVHHRSCDNLKKSSFMSYPSVDGDIAGIRDVDFATGLATQRRRSVRLVDPPKRKIPIRMRSLEGLLNHKETEI